MDRVSISCPGVKEGPTVMLLPVGMKETVNGEEAYYLNSTPSNNALVDTFSAPFPKGGNN